MPFLCISDNDRDKLFIVDIKTMTIAHEVSVGRSPYPVDAIGKDLVYVSTRLEKSVTPVNVSTGKAGAEIVLPHRPRSSTAHPSKALALIGGVEVSLTSVVDTATSQRVRSVGLRDDDDRRDFGGGLACGHPAWATEDSFFHLDRIARRIELYGLSGSEVLSSCNLPTSPHHMEKVGDSFYVMCEGNRGSRIAPSVVRLELSGTSIVVLEHAFLPTLPLSYAQTGGHHLTVDEANNRVYVGTADSRLYTLHAENLALLNVIDSGRGCGHVTLCPDVGLGVTTNHTDEYMTVFELTSGRKHSEIQVSTPQISKKKTQGHTSKWFGSTGFLYTSAAQDGKILEIDPTSKAIVRELHIPGAYVIQGTFIDL